MRAARGTTAHGPVRPETWRAALVVAFAVTGIGLASWVTRTPAIRDALSASTALMGLVIAGLSLGSFVGIACGGAWVTRRGGRAVVAAGLASMTAGQLVVGLGTVLAAPWCVALGLALFGFGMGAGEIGLNVEGVSLEQVWGRIVVPGLHGSFSVGVCGGALLGIWLNAVGVPVMVHLGGAAVVIAGGTLWLVRRLPSGTGRQTGPVGEAGGAWTAFRAGLRVWGERRTLLLGLVILGMALAEGTANDWLPLIVVDGFGLSAATGALVYALFAAAMAVGRFAGGPLIARFGRVPVLRVCAVIGVAGLLLVVLGPNALLLPGVVLWGIGCSLGFPTVLSAAGDDPVDSARRVSAVASAGYLAFLVGPPLLGLLGEAVGLRGALWPVVVLVVLAGVVAHALRSPRPRPSD